MLKENEKTIKKFIKKFLKENNDGFVIDWENEKQEKYFIYFNYSSVLESNKFKFEIDFAYSRQLFGVKFMSKENATKLVDILNRLDEDDFL